MADDRKNCSQLHFFLLHALEVFNRYKENKISWKKQQNSPPCDSWELQTIPSHRNSPMCRGRMCKINTNWAQSINFLLICLEKLMCLVGHENNARAGNNSEVLRENTTIRASVSFGPNYVLECSQEVRIICTNPSSCPFRMHSLSHEMQWWMSLQNHIAYVSKTDSYWSDQRRHLWPARKCTKFKLQVNIINIRVTMQRIFNNKKSWNHGIHRVDSNKCLVRRLCSKTFNQGTKR